TALAPPGWAVAVDSQANVTVTPAPGLQGGSYPIRIIAKSTTNPDLVARAVVDVTVRPTQPDLALSVATDPQFTVPFNGAELPTAVPRLPRNPRPGRRHVRLVVPRPPRRLRDPPQRDERQGPGRTDGDPRALCPAHTRRANPSAGNCGDVHRHRDEQHGPH